MGLCDSCCCMSPRNDTATSGAEINLSRQEKDKTNHLLQESHLMPVSKSTAMNGFCKDRVVQAFFFPPFSPFVCKLRSVRCVVEAPQGHSWPRHRTRTPSSFVHCETGEQKREGRAPSASYPRKESFAFVFKRALILTSCRTRGRGSLQPQTEHPSAALHPSQQQLDAAQWEQYQHRALLPHAAVHPSSIQNQLD